MLHAPTPVAILSRSAILLAAGPWLAGCEIHDEKVQTPAPSRPWRMTNDVDGRRDELRGEGLTGTRLECVEGYEAGRRRATAGGLPMLLVFRAAWCRWSGELATGTLADRDLVALSKRFVCVTIDADRDAETCNAFAVSGFPTIVLVDSQGRERFRATGSMAPGRLTVAMHDVLGTPARPQRVAAGPADEVPR